MLERVHACLCKHLRWLGLLGRVEYSHVHEPETAPTARHTACVSAHVLQWGAHATATGSYPVVGSTSAWTLLSVHMV